MIVKRIWKQDLVFSIFLWYFWNLIFYTHFIFFSSSILSMKSTIHCLARRFHFVFSKHHKKEWLYGRLFQDDCVPKMCTVCTANRYALLSMVPIESPLIWFIADSALRKTGLDKQTIPNHLIQWVHSLP